MARAPVKQIEVDEVIRPVASPVDTFIRTPALADNGASNLQSLAQGLAKFDSGLQGLLAERKAEQDKADAAQAEIDFHKNNQVGYAEAVRTGAIPAFASKAYMNAWKQTEGRNFGTKLQERFNAEYAEWGGKDSEDPKAFDTFLTGFLSRNIPEGTDPQVAEGLRPQLRSMVEQGSNRYIADKDKAIKEKAERATVAGADNSVTEARRKGLETGKVDFDGMFTAIEKHRADGLARGMTEAALDPQIINMVTTKAVEAGGSDGRGILAFLDRKVPGKDYTYAQTPHGREAKVKALDAIDTNLRKSVAEGKTLQKEKDAKEKSDLTRQAIEHLIQNPDTPIPDEVLKRGSVLDGDFRINVMRWQETIRANKASGNQKGLLDLNRAIIEGEGMAAVKAALDHGLITSKEELVAAYKLVQDVEKNTPEVSEALKGDSVKELMNTIKGATARKDNLTNPFAPVEPAGLQAQYDLRVAIMRWAAANPEDAKDPIKREEAIAKIGSLILGRITRAEGGVGAAQYNREGPGMPANPYAQPTPTDPQTGTPRTPFNAAGTPVQPPAQAQAPAPQELLPPLARGTPGQVDQPPLPADPRAANSWYDSLPESSRLVLAEKAAKSGTTFDLYLQKTYEAGLKAGSIAPAPQEPAAAAAPLAEQPSDAVAPDAAATGQALMDALRSPMDFIGWLRGGGAGGPPADQPGAMDAIRNALGDIQSPADFMRWLTGGQDGSYDPRADLPAPGAAPAEGTAEAVQTEPYASGPDDDKLDKVTEETVNAVAQAIQFALTNRTFTSKGNYALSTIKDDPLANRLADFVAGPESNGNYNAVFGKANSTTDLSKFTVDEILQRQKQTVARGGQSATGRYQIIRKTLMGLKKDMGLTGSEMFTPELQDAMFIELAKRRGLEKFRAGKMSLEQFSLNLAKEWASLPDPKTGRSYYAGDGLNKAHVTPGQVRVALLGEDDPKPRKK